MHLVPRYSGIRQQSAEEKRRRAQQAQFRNTFEWGGLAEAGGSQVPEVPIKGLSVQELSEWIEGQKHSVLYVAGLRKQAVAG